MKTAKILSFTTLIAATMGACVVSLAEEVKDSTSTEIVSVEGSDLRNEDALRVAVGDFDDVEFLLSAEDMEAIADNVYVSFNGISAQGYERSVASMFPGEASEQVEATQSASTTFNGALTLASKTNTSETATTGVSSVAMSLSSDNSTEPYATGSGKSYYEQVSTSNSGSAVTTYSATSLLGNFDSVGYTDGSYGISYLSVGGVTLAASDDDTKAGSQTWIGGNSGGNGWSLANWSDITQSPTMEWSIGGGDRSNDWVTVENCYWAQYNDAVFNAEGTTNTTVIVDMEVQAHNLTVTGNKEYTFEYNEGMSLTVNGNVTIGNTTDGTGKLTIKNGTTTIKGSTTIADNYSSLTVSGGTLTIEQKIGTSTTGDVVISDDANIVLSGALLEEIATKAETGEAVAVITANTITFGSITLDYQDSPDSGYVTDLVSQYITVESGAYRVIKWYYYAENGTLYAIVVMPEPSMFGVFAGFGALGLIATRRRRRKAAQPNTSRAPLGLRNRPSPASGL